MRTVLAVGVLAISVPALAQPGRSGMDRSRADRGNDARGGRVEKGGNGRAERRVDGGQSARRGGSVIGGGRVAPRGEGSAGGGRIAPSGGSVIGGGRVAPRGGAPEAQQGRRDPRGGEPDGRYDRRDPRTSVPDGRYDRRDRRDEPRVVVRPPVVNNRHDNRSPRAVPRPYGRGGYRYGDRDFRHRDVLRITTWYRSLPSSRLAFYGYYDRYDRPWGGVRYVFRPGLFLTMDVFGRLALLPYDLEYELGELPWYLERRIYGNTVLVIDTRTRYIVDILEIDY